MYGQLLAQYRVPMHRLYTIALMPSGECTVALTGQTCSHGAFSQCTHIMGCWTMPGSDSSCAHVVAVEPQPVHLALPMATCSLPTTGTLFSDWHATTHALHPVQALRSMVMPHWLSW